MLFDSGAALAGPAARKADAAMPLPPVGQIPGIYHRRVGDIVVTALSDGFFITDREMTRNLAREELAQALAASFRDTVIFSVNAFLIRAGGRTALLETGSGNYLGPTLGHLIGNMKAAGVTPAEVDTVLLTHMHPDHSAGLTDMTTGARNFPNAELVVHENEPRHWYRRRQDGGRVRPLQASAFPDDARADAALSRSHADLRQRRGVSRA